ncbi:MAG: isopentenyl-diphosphate delta-isomerase, partial [Saprospiraceae bacterium]|nr:isopentenyl-diphosphate delta-isomerase [Saprospiraceae bacterium]
NLGIAQIEELIDNQALDKIDALLALLAADGLIIHVNPMQEWLQPEGDRLKRSALESIEQVLRVGSYPVIVKEVGQGFGPESLRALFRLPLAAIDLAGSGGTNFALLEILRKEEDKRDTYSNLAYLGHSAEEMIGFINSFDKSEMKCKEVIISGGIKNFLDGYFLRGKLGLNSVYGQASAFLKFARGDYQALQEYVASQIEGYKLAQNFLKIR